MMCAERAYSYLFREKSGEVGLKILKNFAQL